ncbi:septum site-determining protein MinC [Proteiniborus ethanoligenes]|uniref:Probable septum site-determining protein MinC n=1 Tax=Proteiniborus ethanoligenes TaxID=415015 RepID=A0A1H3SGF0_9FIRM|nr:septum site-determining protein MinC [Proteiniborus ethanoligenes]TAH63585.1 MAG: septum site-determining protein MinC [Gottschalkiaceae bacterium]SDZ37086.1 septum site-determining protein MinC [Proteiniborus ethanoligenes]
MNQSLVTFKGKNNGIYIYVKEGSFQEIKEQLDLNLKKAGSFFNGANVISIKGKKLSPEEKEELKSLIINKYGLNVDDINDDMDDSIDEDIEGDIEHYTTQRQFFEGIEEGYTRFVRATIRSGQSVEYAGNVVIIGDVNPGGIVIASGNIVILGALRGIAHAGCDGNREAIVVAFSLQPTQLRIADIIARKPDEEVEASKWPEIARVEENAVLIETYLPKNK